MILGGDWQGWLMPSSSNAPIMTNRPVTVRSGAGLAYAALVVGLLYAAVSVYWAAGGTALLDTVGGALEQGGRTGDQGVVILVWAAVVLKLIACGLPLLAVHRLGSPIWQRIVATLAWIEAAVLFSYGLTLTTAGLLVQAGVITAGADADHRALAWHAYLWDPWFLVWGLLVVLALLRAREHGSSSARWRG